MSLSPIQLQTLHTLQAVASIDHLTPAQISQMVHSLTTQSLSTALTHSGLTPSEQAQVMSQVTKGMEDALTTALGGQGLQRNKGATGGGGAGQSWLEAIAQAMGQALGDLAQKIVADAQAMQNESGNTSDAKAFQATMADFQAKSQLFSMLANAFSTSIKSIGEGTTTMASKQ